MWSTDTDLCVCADFSHTARLALFDSGAGGDGQGKEGGTSRHKPWS